MELRDIPVKNRTERKKKETKRKIVEVAMRLFERQGFDNTTMEQIAIEADIARKTLYNHFPVKEAIIDEYVGELSKGLAEATLAILPDLPDTSSRLSTALDKAYAWVEINPEITEICLRYRLKNMCQGSGYSENATGTQSIMAEIIRQGQVSGEIRQDISAKLLVMQIDILRCAIVLDWLNDRSKFELRKEIAKMVSLILYGAINREENPN